MSKSIPWKIIFQTCQLTDKCRCSYNVKRFLSSSTINMDQRLQEYSPPSWMEGLKSVPKMKVQLANPDTPIHPWDLPGVPEGFTLSIKRDDLTGSTLSGNKVRKLEFLMADALIQKCKHIITCGGLQSNHCRAVAVCARQLGLTPHLVLRTDISDVSDVDCAGNLLLDRMCAASLYLMPRQSPYTTHLKPAMDNIAQQIQVTTGEKSYHVPVGGSNSVGLFGYLEVFDELLRQGALDQYDDLVFACGSGGTAGGLAIGNFLTGNKLRIHGVAVSDNAAYFHQHVNEMLQAVGVQARSEDILDIIDGHKGRGYGLSTQDELDFLLSVSTSTGIMLDPVYTGKAVKGMIHELTHNPDMFKGNRILYLHTGGVFGLYDGRINDILTSPGAKTNSVTMYTHQDMPAV